MENLLTELTSPQSSYTCFRDILSPSYDCPENKDFDIDLREITRNNFISDEYVLISFSMLQPLLTFFFFVENWQVILSLRPAMNFPQITMKSLVISNSYSTII